MNANSVHARSQPTLGSAFLPAPHPHSPDGWGIGLSALLAEPVGGGQSTSVSDGSRPVLARAALSIRTAAALRREIAVSRVGDHGPTAIGEP